LRSKEQGTRDHDNGGSRTTAPVTAPQKKKAFTRCRRGKGAINISNTPGSQVDYRTEVGRFTSTVLDGAIAVFDGVAGVQSQSETVWRHGTSTNVPRRDVIKQNGSRRRGFRKVCSTASKKKKHRRQRVDGCAQLRKAKDQLRGQLGRH